MVKCLIILLNIFPLLLSYANNFKLIYFLFSKFNIIIIIIADLRSPNNLSKARLLQHFLKNIN